MLRFVAILALVTAAIAVPTLQKATLNNRPVFGILSQPLGEEITSEHPGINANGPVHTNYLAASYVKWLEAAGARVVPIPHNASFVQLDDILKGLNGILFPGGGADLDKGAPFFETAQHVFNRVIEANDNGENMPIWGTCMGFQTLSIIVSQNHNLLQHTDSENLALPLVFTPEASKSRLFSRAFASSSPSSSSPSDTLASLFEKQKITLNNHMWGVLPKDFEASPELSNFFTVLSTNVDRKGVEFISTMEGKKYPVYATQWHPEKNQFEWNPTEVIPHSQDAIAAMQYIADIVVSEARKNSRSYADEETMTRRLIYNYSPEFTGGPGKSFELTYYDIHFV